MTDATSNITLADLRLRWSGTRFEAIRAPEISRCTRTETITTSRVVYDPKRPMRTSERRHTLDYGSAVPDFDFTVENHPNC